MDLQELLFLAATIVFALACRTFAHRIVRKMGLLAMLASSYMLGWFLTGSHVAGACGVGLWFMLPWVEIVVHVRRLRFTQTSEVKGRFAPSSEIFPELHELTQEIEDEGFVMTEDAGWKWSDTDHFMRIFYHEQSRMQATIGMVQQEGIPWTESYISLTSRLQDGLSYTTTNLAHPATMKSAPEQRINRQLKAQSMAEFVQLHETYLTSQGIERKDLAELDTNTLSTRIEQDLRQQIHHNVDAGLIEEAGEGLLRYSWRGCLFLWFQTMKEILIA
jgi:hypothetical protein